MLSIPGGNKWLDFAIGEFSPSFTAHFAGGGFNKGAILFVMSLCLAYSEGALVKCVIRDINKILMAHLNLSRISHSEDIFLRKQYFLNQRFQRSDLCAPKR